MKILITGSNGFVGKNLVYALKNIQENKDRTHKNLNIDEIYEYDINMDISLLNEYCKKADFVFNFVEFDGTISNKLLDTLKKYNNTCPVMLYSSMNSTFDEFDYKDIKLAEELFFEYSKEVGAKVFVYRLPNIFGKWCKPNYNSVVATLCNNIANDIDIQIDDYNTELELIYIDDFISEMIGTLKGKEHRCDYDGLNVIEKSNGMYCYVPITHKVTLGKIVELLYSFKEQPNTLVMPEIPNNSFEKKLYSTYLSYLPKEKVSFPLKMNTDNRGSFTEILKMTNCGQFSVNISKPKVTKGEHWHNTKWEFFIVVSGRGLIQQRRVGLDENGKPYPVIEFEVSGEKIEAVHMLPGYTHNIINLSDTENLVTLMWANEEFNKDNPDTFFEKVVEER